MATQFAGSSSTGRRRRQRIVVNGEGSGTDENYLEGEGAEIESELVASAAAGPWVPVSELRIWLYSSAIGIILAGLTFLLTYPFDFPEYLKPLANHLLSGSHPMLLISAEATFLILSAQLGLLISWYRARCKLDFGGRYRVWPWAVVLFGIAAFFRATEVHRTVGHVAATSNWFAWRGTTTGWLFPLGLAALPISLFLDRDMRNSRSSLWTLRLSGGLWFAIACLELFQPELQGQSWFQSAHLFTPLYDAAPLFVGLWHHARVVAYVCPDPPELEQRSTFSRLAAVTGWIVSRLTFWKRRVASEEDEEVAKPRRKRKKVEADEAATKRKRKAPVKRTTTRTKTRTKPTDEESEEELADGSTEDAVDQASDSDESASESNSSWNDQQEDQWDQEAEETSAPSPVISERKSNGRTTQVHKSHDSSPPAPHSRRQADSWEEKSTSEREDMSSQNIDSSQESEDDQDAIDSGMTAEQFRGLSKRQKRDLKRQLREQQRTRGR